jgi:hypothetical protein
VYSIWLPAESQLCSMNPCWWPVESPRLSLYVVASGIPVALQRVLCVPLDFNVSNVLLHSSYKSRPNKIHWVHSIHSFRHIVLVTQQISPYLPRHRDDKIENSSGKKITLCGSNWRRLLGI